MSCLSMSRVSIRERQGEKQLAQTQTADMARSPFRNLAPVSAQEVRKEQVVEKTPLFERWENTFSRVRSDSIFRKYISTKDQNALLHSIAIEEVRECGFRSHDLTGLLIRMGGLWEDHIEKLTVPENHMRQPGFNDVREKDLAHVLGVFVSAVVLASSDQELSIHSPDGIGLSHLRIPSGKTLNLEGNVFSDVECDEGAVLRIKGDWVKDSFSRHYDYDHNENLVGWDNLGLVVFEGDRLDMHHNALDFHVRVSGGALILRPKTQDQVCVLNRMLKGLVFIQGKGNGLELKCHGDLDTLTRYLHDRANGWEKLADGADSMRLGQIREFYICGRAYFMLERVSDDVYRFSEGWFDSGISEHAFVMDSGGIVMAKDQRVKENIRTDIYGKIDPKTWNCPLSDLKIESGDYSVPYKDGSRILIPDSSEEFERQYIEGKIRLP